eukprot:scaffold22277_cov70-Skeletonema_dohrnii-CCMP3373.AAC.1
MHHHLTALLSSFFSHSGSVGGLTETTENTESHADQSSITSDGGSEETASLEDHLIALPYTLESWTLMKRNDPKKTVCNLNGCDFLPSSAWKEMGETLARNTRVQELYAE